MRALSLGDLAGPARAALLATLRAAPPAGMSVREISRAAGLGLSSTTRELERLDRIGAIDARADRNRLRYRLRRSTPLVRALLHAMAALEVSGKKVDGSLSDRSKEEALVAMCAYFPPEPELWRTSGDPEFLSGVAVMLAGHSGFDRRTYLALGDSLVTGASTVEGHELWYRRYKPNMPRLLAAIDRARHTHARATG